MISSLSSSRFLIARSILVWNREVRSSPADILGPSLQTLKHIAVDIHVDEYLNQLFDIPSEFEEMPTKNIFETVTIEVHVDASSRSGVDWCRLDEIFTTPGWFH